jgi:hypothetical protein
LVFMWLFLTCVPLASSFPYTGVVLVLTGYM